MTEIVTVKVEGLGELRATLHAMPTKIRHRAVRPALKKAGEVIAQEARRLAPVLAHMTPYRTAGTVRSRIMVRPSKFARQQGDEGVFINVKPLRGRTDTRKFGRASARNPYDPFYWRFLEFGTQKMTARRFLNPAAENKGLAAVDVFVAEAKRTIESMDVPGGGP